MLHVTCHDVSCLLWWQVLELCKPDEWTAASMFQATKLFTAGSGVSKAQKLVTP